MLKSLMLAVACAYINPPGLEPKCTCGAGYRA